MFSPCVIRGLSRLPCCFQTRPASATTSPQGTTSPWPRIWRRWWWDACSSPSSPAAPPPRTSCTAPRTWWVVCEIICPSASRCLCLCFIFSLPFMLSLDSVLQNVLSSNISCTPIRFRLSYFFLQDVVVELLMAHFLLSNHLRRLC